MLLTRETYEGYVIQAVSFNGALGRPRGNKKWGEWYPAYRIYREGTPRKLVHQDRLDHPYQSQEEANRSAFRAAEAWIEERKKGA
jgi:hypothetical protein